MVGSQANYLQTHIWYKPVTTEMQTACTQAEHACTVLHTIRCNSQVKLCEF